MKQIEILGIKIDNLNLNELLYEIDYFLRSNSGHYLVTINPEFIVEADKNFKFKIILNEADLRVADGFGLILAACLKGQIIKQRISGADLTLEICKLAEQNNYPIYLLGGFGDTAKLAANNLKHRFPKLNILGAEEGIIYPFFDNENSQLLARINKAKPAIIFVAFGAPKQEKWIKENLARMPSICLAMGVGGTFDFLAGKTPRAPHFMRNLGLEWLFRLIIEPWRVKRIFRAVFVFLWLVIKETLSIKSQVVK